jgi:hypothetical protein
MLCFNELMMLALATTAGSNEGEWMWRDGTICVCVYVVIDCTDDGDVWFI